MIWLMVLGFTYNSLRAMAVEGDYQHPLQSSIERLEHLAATLDTAKQDADDELQREIEDARNRLGQVAELVLLAPVRADAKELARLGYDFVKFDGPLVRYDARENDNHVRMDEEAIRLEPSNWSRLVQGANAARQNVLGVGKTLLTKGDSLMPRESLNDALDFVTYQRAESLRRIKNRADLTLKCIGDLREFSSTTGLRLTSSGQNFAWAQEALQSKYHVSRLADLGALGKNKVVKDLKQMIDKALYYEDTCLPFEGRIFMLNQSEELSR